MKRSDNYSLSFIIFVISCYLQIEEKERRGIDEKERGCDEDLEIGGLDGIYGGIHEVIF